jgi:hypothetical protein
LTIGTPETKDNLSWRELTLLAAILHKYKSVFNFIPTDLQRIHRGFTEDSSRIHRGFIADSSRIHRGFTVADKLQAKFKKSKP